MTSAEDRLKRLEKELAQVNAERERDLAAFYDQIKQQRVQNMAGYGFFFFRRDFWESRVGVPFFRSCVLMQHRLEAVKKNVQTLNDHMQELAYKT